MAFAITLPGSDEDAEISVYMRFLNPKSFSRFLLVFFVFDISESKIVPTSIFLASLFDPGRNLLKYLTKIKCSFRKI